MLATVDGAKPISSKIPQIQAAARMMLRKGMAHLLRRINLEKGSTNLPESRTPHRLPSGSLMLDACRLPIHDKDGARSRKLHAIEPTAIRKLFQLHAISRKFLGDAQRRSRWAALHSNKRPVSAQLRLD
jgi:hypothetical protein